MRLCFTDYPQYVPHVEYDEATNRMVEKLAHQSEVVAVFQIGSVSSPGISDIDLLVVFRDGTACRLDPLKSLSPLDRYLFPHGLYGVSKRDFHTARRLTFFHNYRFLWGEQLPTNGSTLGPEEAQTLKAQIALEYLVRMYVNTAVQRTYGIVKVRGLLLQTKALLYDLDFLSISSGELLDLIQTALLWRQQWFKKRPKKKTLRLWFELFYNGLSEFLWAILSNQTFYLPLRNGVHIARNMVLQPSQRLEYSHEGIVLPSWLGGLGRKYFNLQHRFNQFCFEIPGTSSQCPSILKEQFAFLMHMKRESCTNWPFFKPLHSSLNTL